MYPSEYTCTSKPTVVTTISMVLLRAVTATPKLIKRIGPKSIHGKCGLWFSVPSRTQLARHDTATAATER